MTDHDVPAGDEVVLNELIHQSTRLRIMALIVSVPASDRLAFGFIQDQLGLTPGNLTIHLRKLDQAGYLSIAKEFVDSKPRTWVSVTEDGHRAFAAYLANLERALNWRPREWQVERSPERPAGLRPRPSSE